ncbi:TPA: class I SAM-dependent methyltransferase [Candidatus Woesearchaeota archaeon]|nr:class I SAM-dependent methyltransferase [Candidatus Woesearchaeota archaeon]HII68358.1 class I SAM-dependent methyltransferase [Candidatus Woesearchaeota archaeon]
MGNEGYKDIIESQSTNYDKQRVKHYFKKTFSFFLSLIPEGSRVLDVGCGTGQYSIGLAKHGRPCDGVDYSRKMIEIAAKNAQSAHAACGFALCDVEKGVTLNGPYDYALFVGNWEYFDNPCAVLRNVSSVLRPQGSIIISTPNMLAYPIIRWLELLHLKMAPAFWHFHSWRKSIKKAADGAGLRVAAVYWGFYGLDRVYSLRKNG